MTNDAPLLDRLPPPREIHARMGELQRELVLLRRMLRLSQANREQKQIIGRPDASTH
jgi:hypothetical protein